MRRWFPFLLTLLLFAGVKARAEVGIDIHLGNMAPAPVAAPDYIQVDQAPEMVYVPEMSMYVAVGIPYDIVYVGGRYYYSNGGAWYRSQYYSGPWVNVGPRRLPQGLRKWNIEKIREYRDVRSQAYREQGPKFRGKHFQGRGAVGHDKDHGPHPGKDQGPGR
jgi:hypothetical protein